MLEFAIDGGGGSLTLKEDTSGTDTLPGMVHGYTRVRVPTLPGTGWYQIKIYLKSYFREKLKIVFWVHFAPQAPDHPRGVICSLSFPCPFFDFSNGTVVPVTVQAARVPGTRGVVIFFQYCIFLSLLRQI